jgi:hypothetical protein
VLIVAKDLGARFSEAFERLRGGVTVRVVRPAWMTAISSLKLLRNYGVEEVGVGAVIRDFENGRDEDANQGWCTVASSYNPR